MTARVQNVGLAKVTAVLHAAATRPKYLQWGTGTGKAATDTAVTGTSTAEARTNGTSSQATTTVTNDTYQVAGTITATDTRAITELGVYDAAGSGTPPTGGNMDLYGDFAAVNLASGDSIAFTFKTKFA